MYARATTFSSQCSNSTDYVNRVNVEFMKLGARGVTILAASGDAGAPGRANEHCDQVRKTGPWGDELSLRPAVPSVYFPPLSHRVTQL